MFGECTLGEIQMSSAFFTYPSDFLGHLLLLANAMAWS
jgi:hypothetical protein